MIRILFISFFCFWIAPFSGLNTNAQAQTAAPINQVETVKDDVNISEETSFTSDEFESAFRKLKAQDQLQFELAEAPEQPTFEWLQNFLKSVGRVLQALSPFLKILFWGFVIGIIGLLIYVIVTSIRGFRAARRERQQNEEGTYLYRPSKTQAIILLRAVDALAAQGLYSEAVHQLLFRSIQDIGAAKPNVIRRSYTSREIAELSTLTPDTRHAFTLIATEVERSHFGGQNLDKVIFERCRAAYAKFARPEREEETLSSSIGAMT